MNVNTLELALKLNSYRQIACYRCRGQNLLEVTLPWKKQKVYHCLDCHADSILEEDALK